ncbi:MAG TPA: LLM class flavin-dependent oxidoreductase [Chloroflexota bacterium]|nr:LLM class flavin-dependent oxidoreductase [Chloroflexota bacterium]
MSDEAIGLGINNCRTVADVVDQVAEADRLGAEIAFISEDVNCRDAFQLAALAAVRTDKIRLATGVVNPYTRNPTALAMSIATLDEISQGRAVLGLGSSSPSLVRDQMGLVHAGSVVRMRETVEIVSRLLAGEEVSFGGKHFRYASAKLEVPTVQGKIPIYLAAMGPAMLRLAGMMADGALLNVGASLEYTQWAVAVIRAGEAEAGRPPGSVRVAAWLAVYLNPDRRVALARARSLLATMLSIPGQGELLLERSGEPIDLLGEIRRRYQAYPHRGNLEAAAELIPDDLAERLTFIGDRAAVRKKMEQYRAAGIDVPVVGPAALRYLLTAAGR